MTTTMAPEETLDRRMSARIGTIVITRHGMPHVDRGVRIDHRGYRDWWANYDLSGLHPDEKPPEKLLRLAESSDVIYASTLQRAIHTAQMVAGGRDIITDPVFVEAPLPPPPIWGHRSPGAWGVWARAAWMLGRHEDGESREEAEVRAQAAVSTLTAQALRGQNVLLCAHGWFNRMMRPILRKQGWREVEDCGDSYWSYRRYEKVK
ncbi:MAG: histidine phosphatase family protein [Hyphomonadaceae bacterium JAD_PAG50586_4]|nr:MAG: histidine phosphatase family protein [Hyphomonadaceae bacterium JAD_PAG50586_4]